jgi:hypothetical protein
MRQGKMGAHIVSKSVGCTIEDEDTSSSNSSWWSRMTGMEEMHKEASRMENNIGKRLLWSNGRVSRSRCRTEMDELARDIAKDVHLWT